MFYHLWLGLHAWFSDNEAQAGKVIWCGHGVMIYHSSTLSVDPSSEPWNLMKPGHIFNSSCSKRSSTDAPWQLMFSTCPQDCRHALRSQGGDCIYMTLTEHGVWHVCFHIISISYIWTNWLLMVTIAQYLLINGYWLSITVPSTVYSKNSLYKKIRGWICFPCRCFVECICKWKVRNWGTLESSSLRNLDVCEETNGHKRLRGWIS